MMTSGNVVMELSLTLAGIEAECRAVQASIDDKVEAKTIALDWWERNFSHKYPDYKYDVVKKEIVRRNGNFFLDRHTA